MSRMSRRSFARIKPRAAGVIPSTRDELLKVLERVDVVYRRIDDQFLDPVVFRSDSLLGVPGIVSAARSASS